MVGGRKRRAVVRVRSGKSSMVEVATILKRSRGGSRGRGRSRRRRSSLGFGDGESGGVGVT